MDEKELLQLIAERHKRQDEFRRTAERYVDGAGQVVSVHARNASCDEGCCIHNPSDHVMKDFPTFWRDDRGLMERTCPHGVGHPDPDAIAFIRKMAGDDAAATESVHGCDGCCTHGVPFLEWTEEQRVAIGLPSDEEIEKQTAEMLARQEEEEPLQG